MKIGETIMDVTIFFDGNGFYEGELHTSPYAPVLLLGDKIKNLEEIKNYKPVICAEDKIVSDKSQIMFLSSTATETTKVEIKHCWEFREYQNVFQSNNKYWLESQCCERPVFRMTKVGDINFKALEEMGFWEYQGDTQLLYKKTLEGIFRFTSSDTKISEGHLHFLLYMIMCRMNYHNEEAGFSQSYFDGIMAKLNFITLEEYEFLDMLTYYSDFMACAKELINSLLSDTWHIVYDPKKEVLESWDGDTLISSINQSDFGCEETWTCNNDEQLNSNQKMIQHILGFSPDDLQYAVLNQ